MSLFSAMNISSSGMATQRVRVNVTSGNLANINTTRTPQGGPYRRREVVVAALPEDKNFLDELNSLEDSASVRHAKVVGIVEDAREPILRYDPSHPDSNEEGYVELPNIDISEEMVNLMQARRTYEANIAAFNVTKNLALKSLDIST